MDRNMKEWAQNNSLKKIWLAVGIVLLLAIIQILHAEPVRDRVLADLDIRDQGECAIIRVGFNFPVRYVKHFPPTTGDEIRIKLLPIIVSPVDREALFDREAVRPQVDNPAALLEVIYEGDIEGGPFLTLLFQQPRSYQVKQGDDYRSLEIVVARSTLPAPCIEER